MFSHEIRLSQKTVKFKPLPFSEYTPLHPLYKPIMYTKSLMLRPFRIHSSASSVSLHSSYIFLNFQIKIADLF